MSIPLQLDFLAEIRYIQAILEFTIDRPTDLPPFGGSSLRGVLGHAFRRHLCAFHMPCPGECALPETCPYFHLFDRERPSPGQGPSLPKPYILDPLVPFDLEEAAMGAPTLEELPPLQSPGMHMPAGSVLPLRLTLIGTAIPLLPSIVEALVVAPLSIGSGTFRFVRATDPATGLPICDIRMPEIPVQVPAASTMGRLLALPDPLPRQIQIAFLTPTRLRAASEYCFEAGQLAAHFWESALTRAMRFRDYLCCPGAARLPFMDLPEELPELIGHSLRHYALRRLSNRQKRFMDFDGVIGSLYFEGDFGLLLPLARAVELLHLGQKATFGLGRVRCILR